MSFIVTADGNDLDLEHPSPGHVTIYDIAWALSQENRYGRCVRPYSVAEHSLLVCEIAERELGLDVHGQLAALMHDACEAYCRDMYGPAKSVINRYGAGGVAAHAWMRWEEKWARLVAQCFSIVTPTKVYALAIHEADLRARATEKRDLLPRATRPWRSLKGIEPVTWVDLYSPERRSMGWEDWRDRFMDKYHELDFARNELSHPTHHPV